MCEDIQYKISELFEKYKDNEDIILKMNNYIVSKSHGSFINQCESWLL